MFTCVDVRKKTRNWKSAFKVELHLRAKKVKAQALNFWRLNFFK